MSKQNIVLWMGLVLIVVRMFTTNQWKQMWKTLQTSPPATGRSGQILPFLPPSIAIGGTASYDGQTVAAWFVPLLQCARSSGWSGKVVSGYRSFADQQKVCATGVQPCATPGQSHHQGLTWPDGAIDVSPGSSLQPYLASCFTGSGVEYAGSKDPVHYSVPGSHRSGEGTY